MWCICLAQGSVKYCNYNCVMVRDSRKHDKLSVVFAGAGFSLLFAETILLAIDMALVNAFEYFASYFHGFSE